MNKNKQLNEYILEITNMLSKAKDVINNRNKQHDML